LRNLCRLRFWLRCFSAAKIGKSTKPSKIANSVQNYTRSRCKLSKTCFA
jgi:hypothetical protein